MCHDEAKRVTFAILHSFFTENAYAFNLIKLLFCLAFNPVINKVIHCHYRILFDNVLYFLLTF